MKVLYWVLAGVVALVLMLFAVSNREVVTIELWPLPVEGSMPLYLAILLILLIGILLGAVAAWISAGRWRRETRRLRRRVDALERELGATQAKLAADNMALTPAKAPTLVNSF